jgi:ankyrin repeat protein
LIDEGADLDAKDDNGSTALMHLAQSMCSVDKSTVKKFYRIADNPLGKPFMDLAQEVDQLAGQGVNALEALCRADADVNKVNKYGNTALMIAAASPPKYLGAFYLREDKRVIEVLLKYKAKTDTKNNDGKTALALAREAGNTHIAEILISAGAKE